MTKPQLSRTLLGSASLIAALGAAIHAAAFGRLRSVIAASHLPALAAGSFQGLWLSDTATLFLAAVLFLVVAVRPAAAARSVVVLIALIPAATAVLIYTFLGAFFAGHLLLLIAVLGLLGSWALPQKITGAVSN